METILPIATIVGMIILCSGGFFLACAIALLSWYGYNKLVEKIIIKNPLTYKGRIEAIYKILLIQQNGADKGLKDRTEYTKAMCELDRYEDFETEQISRLLKKILIFNNDD